MAWTKEVKEKRVSDREVELAAATKRAEAFETDKVKAQAALAKFTPEEKEARDKRVRKARRELDWALSAPVEGEDEDE